MPASSNLFLRPFIALAVALFCVLSTQNIQAAEPDGAMATGIMMEQCKEMHEKKKQMMADMKIQDTALTEQVAQMNSAADDKKLGLLAALVTRMAEQRIAKNVHMASMSDTMMKHMMLHMEKGKESMQGCPMMKEMGMNDMKGMKGKAMEDKPSDPVKVQK